MEEIPGAVVEETWRELATFSTAQAKRYMKHIGKAQPYLLAFVLGTTEDLSTDAHELANYMFVVIHRIFEKAAGKIGRVTDRKIDAMHEQNESFIASFENANERFLERAAKTVASKQPFVMKYVVETLVEAPESDEPVELTDEESGQIFLTLKTVIDLLDAAA